MLAGDQDTVTETNPLLRDEQLMLPIANLNNMESLLDFATLIKNKRSPHPLTVLTVVPNNELAEQNLKNARKNLDSTAKYASGSETEVNMMATVDFNIASGISRAAQEVGADGIILGWPSKAGIIEKMVGEKTESILNQTDTNLFMCSINKSLVSHSRILVCCPPLAESELGFDFWMEKVLRLSSELTITVTFVCGDRTENAINGYMAGQKQSAKVYFVRFDEWDDLQQLRPYVLENDLIVFVSARTGEVSHRHALGALPTKLGDVYATHNRILVFPARRPGYMLGDYEDVETSPILKRLSEGMGRAFN